MSNPKYIRPKDVEDQYSIKVSTLSKQRQGKYGLPFHVVGRKKNQNRGGVILIHLNTKKPILMLIKQLFIQPKEWISLEL